MTTLSSIILTLILFFCGASLGSFFCVIVTRSTHSGPASKRSRCDYCHQQLKTRDLFPVIGYLLNKGQCRYCEKSIPKWYFWAELSGGLLFALLALGIWNNLFTHPFFNSPQSFLFVFSLFCFTGVLYLISLFDNAYFWVPKQLIYLLIGISLASISWPITLQTAIEKVLGGIIGGSLVGGQYLITGKKGLGLGDVFISLATGFYLGWQYFLVALISGYSLAVIVNIPKYLTKKRATIRQKIPLAPYFLIGVVMALLMGSSIISLY
ncbi:MAG: A24 family peptidase [bacterium]|nr:A24 family peptidase [bacterium]